MLAHDEQVVTVIELVDQVEVLGHVSSQLSFRAVILPPAPFWSTVIGEVPHYHSLVDLHLP